MSRSLESGEANPHATTRLAGVESTNRLFSFRGRQAFQDFTATEKGRPDFTWPALGMDVRRGEPYLADSWEQHRTDELSQLSALRRQDADADSDIAAVLQQNVGDKLDIEIENLMQLIELVEQHRPRVEEDAKAA